MNYESRFEKISKDEQYTLISLVILDKMMKKHRVFSPLLEGDDTHLEPVFDFLIKNRVMDIDDEIGAYVPSPKGRKLYEEFLKRYKEYLRIYDVFCAVDLGKGEFGFEKIFEFGDEEFGEYLCDERFGDLRVTVCEFKGINPWEIVFISFMIEKRFREPKDRSDILGEDSWQSKAIYGDIFEEIRAILNNSLHWEELGYEDEQGAVPAQDVISDVIRQGVELSKDINRQRAQTQRREEAERAASRPDPNEVAQETTTTYYDYDPYWYDPWYDPYYVSPIWGVALVGLILL